MIHESQCTQEATPYATFIVDAKYKKTDLQVVVRPICLHLSLHYWTKFLEVLQKYDNLCGSKLGEWNAESASFELKEGAEPYHGRAYPVL